MQISRSTLRQALGVLTSSGHLVAIRGRSGGTFVADSPPVGGAVTNHLLARYDELIAYRTVIEMGAATLAAERADEDRIVAVEAAVRAQQAVSPGDPVGYIRADAAFHLALGRAPGIVRLEKEMTEVQGECMDLIVARIRAKGLPQELLGKSLSQHEGIAAAIRARDPETAGRLAREHMRLFGDSMQD